MNIINDSTLIEATEIRDDVAFSVVKCNENFSYIKSTPVFKNFEKFIELSQTYPVVEPLGFEDYNPTLKQYFYPQHLYSITNLIESKLFDFFPDCNIILNNHFANIHSKYQNVFCPLMSGFPHVDSHLDSRIAVNFWISSNPDDATSIWKVNGSYIHTDDSEKYKNECISLYCSQNNIDEECVPLFNLENNILGIEKIIDIPSEPNTIVLYFSNYWHSPKIDFTGKYLRWSYMFFYELSKNTISD